MEIITRDQLTSMFLSGDNLCGIILEGSNLKGIDLSSGVGEVAARLSCAKLVKSDLRGSRLKEVELIPFPQILLSAFAAKPKRISKKHTT